MKMKCPRCSSENVQVHYEVEKQGFSGGKGCCGWILIGPIGLLCGLCGKDKVKSEEKYWVCNNCGSKFTDYEAEKGDKQRMRDAVLDSAEINFVNDPRYTEVLNKRDSAIQILKSRLTDEELNRFVFSYNGIQKKTAKDIVWNYIKPDFNIDLSNDCIYFMYNESTIGDGLGTIFTNRGIYCYGAFAKPIFIPKENISSINIHGKDIQINDDKIFLDFAKIKSPDTFEAIRDFLIALYLK